RVGRNPGRIIPGVLLAFADGRPTGRVRIVGEPIWAGRTAVEYPACAQHEALINLAFAADRPVTILCPYDAERLGRQVLADAEATHPLLVDASGAHDSPGYAPRRIIAEYNLSLPAVAAAQFTFDATTLAQARRFASDHATRLGLDGDHTELELIVGELTANSVAHGGGSGSLGLWTEESYLICEVRDVGHITDPLAGRRPANRHQLNGRGLLLVHQLADLVRVHTTAGGTTIRVYLRLPASAAPQGDRRPPPGATMAPGGSLPAGNGTTPDRSPLRWQTDDALRAAARFARYLPPDDAAGFERRERHGVRPVLEALAAAEVLVQVVELWRTKLVTLARLRGARWAEIGRALGVSKQAAHERYAGTRRRVPGREASAQGQPGVRSVR
ncbi:MAG: anti-sigma factor RsbA family regulatory protein, partial [Pseudonocardiaceae bacterium]